MDHVKQKLRRLLQEMLITVTQLPAVKRREKIRERLEAIQDYCASVEKTFIVFELRITCDQYDLGGSKQHTATLFRGPNEDASVAICITDRGSLLHRNDSAWQIYCDAGDVNPVGAEATALAA
ncbi:MAG: hypothetical protein AAGF01_08120 [Cyanobacteria bacterium P01_G01_bin.38]